VQVDPFRTMLKAPGTKRLTLNYDGPLSKFAFNFNLRRHTMVFVLSAISPQKMPGVGRCGRSLAATCHLSRRDLTPSAQQHRDVSARNASTLRWLSHHRKGNELPSRGGGCGASVEVHYELTGRGGGPIQGGGCGDSAQIQYELTVRKRV
jgi:hypothetical protein